MGFWSKVKGVFGRIGSGVKRAINWIGDNKQKIDQALDTAQGFVPSKYQQGFNIAREKAGDIYNKIGSVI